MGVKIIIRFFQQENLLLRQIANFKLKLIFPLHDPEVLGHMSLTSNIDIKMFGEKYMNMTHDIHQFLQDKIHISQYKIPTPTNLTQQIK